MNITNPAHYFLGYSKNQLMPVSYLLQTVSVHMNFCELQSVFHNFMKIMFDILSTTFWFIMLIIHTSYQSGYDTSRIVQNAATFGDEKW